MRQRKFSFWAAAALFSAVFLCRGAAPTLTITAPTANLRVSNAVFTVTGTAADTAGVSNVVYSLNNTGWVGADTTNSWTNWSAQVALKPGTNIVSAHAVNNGGTNSKTGTVRFVCVVTDVLTVRTNGHGGILPAYDGARLQIGVNYSMTATPTKPLTNNYGLVTWTDGSSNVVGRSPKLTFMMASNLTLTANFGDAADPVVRVLSSATNSNGDPNSLILNGSASDNVAVTNVYYQVDPINIINQYAWIPVTDTTNHW
ncbi:MAG TPA: Ig-like domain-containing protein, partial [Verrucomicrobiae bacterium]